MLKFDKFYSEKYSNESLIKNNFFVAEKLSQNIKDKIIELRKQGLSTANIGKQLGVSQSSVFQSLPPELKNIGLRNVNPDIKDKIIELRKQGLSTNAIGKQLGVSQTTVYNSLPGDLKNISAKKPSTERKKISSSQVVLDKMIELRKQGLSTTKIGKMLGVSQMTVYNSLPQELKDIGLQSTPQDKKDKIIELRKQGLSLRGISKQVGVSDRAVYYILPPELRNIGLKRGPKLSYFTGGGGI